jgi:hypothetical protein
MPFANADAKATSTATRPKVAASAPAKPIDAVDAINRFEGPANGIKLKANEVAKIISKSIGDAMLHCLRVCIEDLVYASHL